MSVSRLQDLKVLLHGSATQTSVTHALNSTAPAGSKILFGGFVDKTTTVTPTDGFTSLIARNNTSISFFAFWKVAAGTELNLVANFGDSANNTCKTFSYVFSADADIDVHSYSPNPYVDTAVRSIAAAVTSALGLNPYLAIGAIGADSVGGIAAGTNIRINNGYTLVNQNYTDSSPGGVPAMAIAEKTSGFTTTGESFQFDYDGGTTDQMATMLLVIRDTNPSTTTAKPAYYYAQA